MVTLVRKALQNGRGCKERIDVVQKTPEPCLRFWADYFRKGPYSRFLRYDTHHDAFQHSTAASSRHAAYTTSATDAKSSVHAERPQMKWEPNIGFAPMMARACAFLCPLPGRMRRPQHCSVWPWQADAATGRGNARHCGAARWRPWCSAWGL